MESSIKKSKASFIEECGKMECRMVRVKRPGKTARVTSVSLKRVKRMDAESTFGKINQNTQASGTKIKYTGWESTNGVMEGNTRDNGKTSK